MSSQYQRVLGLVGGDAPTSTSCHLLKNNRARAGGLLIGGVGLVILAITVCGRHNLHQTVQVSLGPGQTTEALFVQQSSPAQQPVGTGPYACGVPLALNQTAFVLQEYNTWKKKYLVKAEGGLCIVRPVGDVSANTKFPRDCVSEGIGYGMLLSAYLADKSTFDGLWSFSQRWLDQNGIMHWQIHPGGPNPIAGSGGATDADEDIAMALLVAAQRWGSSYLERAKQQIDKVWMHEIDQGSASVKPGDGWGTCADVDPSYFSPAWYKIFGEVTGKSADWRRPIDAGFNMLSKCNARSGGTGLTPQWTDCNCQVSPNVGKYPDKYWCDSVRVPLRMAISAAWHCDKRAAHQTQLLSTFFGKKGAGNLQRGYTIEGGPFMEQDTENSCTSNCLVVTAAAALVTGSADMTSRTGFWRGTSQPPAQGQSCYFCDVLRMLSLLFTTGLMPPPNVNAKLDPTNIPLGAAPMQVLPPAAPPASPLASSAGAVAAPGTVAGGLGAPAVPSAAGADLVGAASQAAAKPAAAGQSSSAALAPGQTSAAAPATEEAPQHHHGVYRCGVPLNLNATAFVLKEYQQWKAKYLLSVDGSVMCIMRPGGDVSANTRYPRDCVSEGTGYGMLLAAYLADRRTFDALWRFSQKNLDENQLMNWQIWPGHPSPAVGKGGATDADEDMAMALIVAASRWGGHYKPLAKQQIERIWQHEVDQASGAVLPGDSWGSCKTIDPSYFSPAWFKVFGELTGKSADWKRVVDTGFTTTAKCNAKNHGTGLTPQWTDCNCETSPNVGKYPEHYWCDSVRVPLRMAISAAWHCDPRAILQTKLLASFFGRQGSKGIKKGYTLDGQPLQTNENEIACTEQCFVVTAAAAFVTGTRDEKQRDEFWKAIVQAPSSQQSCYFCDVLRMLSLVFASGLMPEPDLDAAGLSPAVVPLGAKTPPMPSSSKARATTTTKAPTTRTSKAPTPPPPTPSPLLVGLPTLPPAPTLSLATAPPVTTEPPRTGGQIRSRLGYCLESVQSSRVAEAHLVKCDPHRDGQIWKQSSAGSAITDSHDRCLDADFGIKSSGLSPLGTLKCKPKTASQNWGYTATAGGTEKHDGYGFIVNHFSANTMVCLRALPNSNGPAFVKLQVCNASDPSQLWQLEGADTTGPELALIQTRK